MKIDDLRNKWIKDHDLGVCIAHNNMKTVKFWPISLTSTKDHYEIFGHWICLQTDSPLEQETIKIKVEDLDNWNVVE
jgi:hypothetical protein